jgi:hypothetical protein
MIKRRTSGRKAWSEGEKPLKEEEKKLYKKHIIIFNKEST